MSETIIRNAKVVNEGKVAEVDVKICNERIEKVSSQVKAGPQTQIIDAKGAWLLPGMIDDQVHFREPGLEFKGTIASESKAAITGGITSFMEMPNVKPSTTTQSALLHKHGIAKQTSLANYSFYLGATPDNIEDIKACDPNMVCGVKVFMGASTGDLLVEHPTALEAIFRECPILIATHCESGEVIARNLAKVKEAHGTPQIEHHPVIRDTEACYASSSYATSLAKRYNSDLHVLHLTTEKELDLFEPGPIEGKKITAEACVHHLWFNREDYPRLGNLIKCNPAIKAESDRQALLAGVLDGRIDIIATDHAPHTWEEKQKPFENAPAGLPLVEHALLTLFEQVAKGTMSLSQVVEKISHNPAKRYQVAERGFIREGYYADLVLVAEAKQPPITHKNTQYLCKWSPFVDFQFSHKIMSTFVNGYQVYDGHQITSNSNSAKPLVFNR